MGDSVITMWRCPLCGRAWIGRMFGPGQFDMTEWWGIHIVQLRGDRNHPPLRPPLRSELFASCNGIPHTVEIPDHVLAAYLIGGQYAAQDLVNEPR